MKKASIISYVCIMMMGISLCFAGCGSGPDRTFTEVRELYSEYIQSNPDIFDSNGVVNIQYSEKLVTLGINGSSDKEFTKLSNDPTNPQAIFEPAFKSAMLISKNYLLGNYSFAGIEFDVNRTTKLYNKLEKLKQATTDFKHIKLNLDTNDFNPDGATEAHWLDQFLDKYYVLVGASCDFGLEFAQLYRDYIYKHTDYVQGERLSVGLVRLEYLTRLAEFAEIQYKSSIKTYYKKVVPTDAPIKNAANELLRNFAAVESLSFEGATGEILTNKEQNIIDNYLRAEEYLPTYNAERSMAFTALNEFDISNLYEIYINTDKSFTASQQACWDKVMSFLNTDCTNLTEYFKRINESIIAFNQ